MSFFSNLRRAFGGQEASDGRLQFRSQPPMPEFDDDAPLPGTLLTEAESLRATEWLRLSLTKFGYPVSAFVPGHFAAYARIYHPFVDPGSRTLGDPERHTWKTVVGRQLPETPHDAADIAMRGAPTGQAPTGCAPRHLVEALAAALATQTTTPKDCCFAVWEGFGDLQFSPRHRPTLRLPQRAYHVFAGELARVAEASGYSTISFSYRSPNLWWPADHAWCVATEIDHAWTYVAGSRACVDSLLSDARLEAAETSADAAW